MDTPALAWQLHLPSYPSPWPTRTILAVQAAVKDAIQQGVQELATLSVPEAQWDPEYQAWKWTYPTSESYLLEVHGHIYFGWTSRPKSDTDQVMDLPHPFHRSHNTVWDQWIDHIFHPSVIKCYNELIHTMADVHSTSTQIDEDGFLEYQEITKKLDHLSFLATPMLRAQMRGFQHLMRYGLEHDHHRIHNACERYIKELGKNYNHFNAFVTFILEKVRIKREHSLTGIPHGASYLDRLHALCSQLSEQRSAPPMIALDASLACLLLTDKKPDATSLKKEYDDLVAEWCNFSKQYSICSKKFDPSWGFREYEVISRRIRQCITIWSQINQLNAMPYLGVEDDIKTNLDLVLKCIQTLRTNNPDRPLSQREYTELGIVDAFLHALDQYVMNILKSHPPLKDRDVGASTGKSSIGDTIEQGPLTDGGPYHPEIRDLFLSPRKRALLNQALKKEGLDPWSPSIVQDVPGQYAMDYVTLRLLLNRLFANMQESNISDATLKYLFPQSFARGTDLWTLSFWEKDWPQFDQLYSSAIQDQELARDHIYILALCDYDIEASIALQTCLAYRQRNIVSLNAPMLESWELVQKEWNSAFQRWIDPSIYTSILKHQPTLDLLLNDPSFSQWNHSIYSLILEANSLYERLKLLQAQTISTNQETILCGLLISWLNVVDLSVQQVIATLRLGICIQTVWNTVTCISQVLPEQHISIINWTLPLPPDPMTPLPGFVAYRVISVCQEYQHLYQVLILTIQEDRQVVAVIDILKSAEGRAFVNYMDQLLCVIDTQYNPLMALVKQLDAKSKKEGLVITDSQSLVSFLGECVNVHAK